jgi:pimeloyl-ACP methyl ester carboxylesterase
MPHISNQGIRIYYEIEGSGPPLVLQHGLTDSLRGWYEYGFVDFLKHHYRLIMIDARGHGRSDKPHDPEAYDLRLCAADIVAVLDDLQIERSGYYGYSLGGLIGFSLAHGAPQRLSSLTIGGAHPYAANSDFYRRMFNGGMTSWLGLLEQLAGPPPFMTRARILSNDIEALRAGVARDSPDQSTMLPHLPFPYRLLVGELDPIAPIVEQCAGTLPGAQFFLLPGLNHFQATIRSDLVAPIIRSAGVPLAVVAHEVST